MFTLSSPLNRPRSYSHGPFGAYRAEGPVDFSEVSTRRWRLGFRAKRKKLWIFQGHLSTDLRVEKSERASFSVYILAEVTEEVHTERNPLYGAVAFDAATLRDIAGALRRI